jgi:hypothetical protein
VCNEGYASSLAAAALHYVGHTPCQRHRRCLRPGAPAAYHHRTGRNHRHSTDSPVKQITA